MCVWGGIVLNSSIMHEDLFSSCSTVEKWSNCQSKNMFKHFVMYKKKQEKASEHPVQWACINGRHMVVWPSWPPYADNQPGSARRVVNNNENYL